MQGFRPQIRPLRFVPVIFSLFLLYANGVFAHARWSLDGPVPPRTTATGLKEPAPCGGVARTATPVILKSGDTIVVEFEETINHPGYFRIAFSPAGDLNFDDNVLVESIPQVPATRFYPQSITLPDIECDDCTLQLIQVMEDRNPPTNYYSCADIMLTATGGVMPPGGDMTAPDDVSGLVVSGGDTQANLSWTNPANDFFQVLVLQSTATINTAPVDTQIYQTGDVIGGASVIYAGNASAITATGLLNGSSYFFKVFAHDSSYNYAPGNEQGVTLQAAPLNVAPQVSLIAEQSQQQTLTVDTQSGNVIVQAVVSDANPADSHSFDWSATDNQLVDLDVSQNNFTFSPAGLSAGNYTVRVEVSDDGVPQQSAVAQIRLTVSDSSTTDAQDDNARDENGGSGSSGAGFLFMLFFMLIHYWRPSALRESCR